MCPAGCAHECICALPLVMLKKPKKNPGQSHAQKCVAEGLDVQTAQGIPASGPSPDGGGGHQRHHARRKERDSPTPDCIHEDQAVSCTGNRNGAPSFVAASPVHFVVGFDRHCPGTILVQKCSSPVSHHCLHPGIYPVGDLWSGRGGAGTEETQLPHPAGSLTGF